MRERRALRGFQRRHVMRERGRRGALDLGQVVPQPQPHGVVGERLRDESRRLFRGEDAALQRQAALGVGGQRFEIAVARRAQVALGVDVQLDRRQDVVVEQRAQERQRGVLMHVVHAAQRRRFALVVQQVSQVMQQRCRDQRRRGARVLGTHRGLQRVLQLRDRLAGVGAAALAGEQDADVGNREGHGGSQAVRGLRFCQPALPLPLGAGTGSSSGTMSGSGSFSRVRASTPASSRIG